MENANMNYIFFKEFGISEIKEKFIILSFKEQLSVLNDLKNGVESELLSMVKKPFPEFIIEYYKKYYPQPFAKHYSIFKSFINEDSLVNDLTLGYRLFILPEQCLRLLNDKLKMSYGENVIDPVKNSTADRTIMEYLNQPLERIHLLKSANGYNRNALKKYIYIMKYVSKDEAKRLGLKTNTFYTNGEYRGFDLEGKLNSLNPFIRTVVRDYIGVDGYSPLQKEEMTKRFNISDTCYEKLFSMEFLLNLCVSCGQFRNSIGYIDRNYQDNERIQYSTKSFRDLTDRIDAMFIYDNLKTDDVKNISTQRNLGKNHIYYLIKVYGEAIPELLDEYTGEKKHNL